MDLNKHTAGCLIEKEMDYLTDFEIKCSIFYGLPKVHKSQKIQQACSETNTSYIQVSNITDLKLRPTVAGLTPFNFSLMCFF